MTYWKRSIIPRASVLILSTVSLLVTRMYIMGSQLPVFTRYVFSSSPWAPLIKTKWDSQSIRKNQINQIRMPDIIKLLKIRFLISTDYFYCSCISLSWSMYSQHRYWLLHASVLYTKSWAIQYVLIITFCCNGTGLTIQLQRLLSLAAI